MKQEQEGGEGSTNNQAGRDIIYNGISPEQFGELNKYIDGQVAGEVERVVDRQLESIRADFVKFTGESNAQAMAAAGHMLKALLEQLAIRAPQNIGAFKTVDMQQAVLNAATSAAVVADDELTDTLVDILVDKSGAEPRSFKGVVLTEALEVAGKLTAEQVNLLTALVMITRTVSHGMSSVDSLLEGLDSRCRPLYGKIPTTNSAIQYMAYTGVGDIERSQGMLMGQVSIANTIVRSYDAVLTIGFLAEDLSEELSEMGATLPHVDARVGDADRLRVPVASSQTLDRMARDNKLQEPFLTHIEALKKLMVDNVMSVEKFMELLDSMKPELAQFLRDLDAIGAQTFMLSSVGIAIGQANWRRLEPDGAPKVDIYLT